MNRLVSALSVEVNNFGAIVYVLIAIFLFSLAPLFIARTSSVDSPFLFNCVWRIATGLGCLLFLLVTYRPLILNPDVWEKFLPKSVSWLMFGAFLHSFEYGFLAWSTRWLDVSIAAVLFELWPIVLIALTARLFGATERYQRNLKNVFPLLLFAFCGLIFVIGSQAGEGTPDLRIASWLQLLTGLGLCLAAVGMASCASFMYRWGNDIAKDIARVLPDDTLTQRSERSLVFFGTIACCMLISLAGGVVSGGIGYVSGEQIAASSALLMIAGGLLSLATGTVAFRLANLKTSNLGINALAYLTPVLSLAWLAIFSEISVGKPDYLVLGASAIISANLLINFEAERLLGFKALVISLWTCGTLVYVRDVAKWGWVAKSDAYFDILFLSATVFALILSFRVARLSTRTQEEDNRALKLYRDVEELAERGVIQSGVGGYVLTMDEKVGREMEDAYVDAREIVRSALEGAAAEEREKLRSIEVDLDTLANSRQQGINFGELCSLFIFSGLVVGTALLTRPADVQGLTGFLVEMFAMLFPAVIVFLTFNVLDLQRDRVSKILEDYPRTGGYGVAFLDTVRQRGQIVHTGRRIAEQWISVAVGLGLIVAYACLFLDKWGLWPQVWNGVLNFLL